MARHDYTRGREGQATALTHTEVMALLEDLRDYCSPKYQVLFATQYFTAGRISEVRTLELRDIDWQQGRNLLPGGEYHNGTGQRWAW